MATVNLCFHGIGVPQRELEPGEDGYWITEDTFEQVIGLVAGRPDVRLSFDDGNTSDYSIGLPVLQRHGLTATFFPIADRVDQPGSLSAEQIRHLLAAGMPIGSHGMRHRPWRGLTAAEVEEEFVQAREQLSELIGRPITEAACPLGRYDRTVLSALRRLGYQRVYTSDRVPARPGAWLQARFSLSSTDTVESIRQILDEAPSVPRRVLGAARVAVKRLR